MKQLFRITVACILFSITFSDSALARGKDGLNETNQANKSNEGSVDTTKYAILHLYRPRNPVGGLVGYNISLDDSVIYKLKNNRKVAIKIYKEGPVKIWPGDEPKKVTINLKFGEEYFLKFGMVSGLVGARPELNLIDREQGRIEYDAIVDKKKKNKSGD
jgi:hypothetical protein